MRAASNWMRIDSNSFLTALCQFEHECRDVLARVDVVPCDEKNRSLGARVTCKISICENTQPTLVRMIDAGAVPINGAGQMKNKSVNLVGIGRTEEDAEENLVGRGPRHEHSMQYVHGNISPSQQYRNRSQRYYSHIMPPCGTFSSLSLLTPLSSTAIL